MTGWDSLQATASPIEVVWTVPALMGWAVYSWRYGRAYRAWGRGLGLLPPPAGCVLLTLRMRCLRAVCLLLAFECWTLAGAIALLEPPTPGLSDPQNPAAWFVGSLFFLAMLVLLLKGGLLERREAALVRMHELRERT